VAILGVIARVIVVITAIIALIIAIGIILRVLEANPQNSIASFFDDLARALVGPFNDLFRPKDPKGAIVANWGIAMLVYLLVGQLLARVLRRVSPEP
jgi:hypothetical protein